MESKLLVGGKTIIDHTNEQQKMLEMKRQEIAEQVILRLLLLNHTFDLESLNLLRRSHTKAVLHDIQT